MFIQTPTGSGFIVDGNGTIITNLHGVQNNPRVRFRLFDGATATGAVAARHPRADLAVVRVPVGTLLRPLSLGNGRAIRAGADVAALGFPLGDQLGNELMVTEGIVSAKRIYDGIAQFQTSAAINPGNSAGLLVAQNDGQAGRVIGVVTRGIDRANDGRDIENTNFAISINVVREWLRPTTRWNSSRMKRSGRQYRMIWLWTTIVVAVVILPLGLIFVMTGGGGLTAEHAVIEFSGNDLWLYFVGAVVAFSVASVLIIWLLQGRLMEWVLNLALSTQPTSRGRVVDGCGDSRPRFRGIHPHAVGQHRSRIHHRRRRKGGY